MLHKFLRLLAVLGLFTPLGASPLGLGDITLHSALNQPLDADIELTALGQTRNEDITVALASVAAFENAGLDRSLPLTGLRFEVVSGVDGTPYIKATSADPIKEPFLDFLVEVDWPSGHLLREYTLLLDPPVVIDEEPLPVQPALAGETAAPSGDFAMDEPAAPAVAAPAPAAGAPTADALTYGPVQRSDTLWSIASQLQQSSSAATVEQVMMALLTNNPEAFYNDNINELKAGYVLRVSDPELLTAMTRAAAAAEVRRQNEQWMDSKQARAGMAGAAPQGIPDGVAMGDAAAGGGGDSGPRLRLSVPEATATGMALEGVAEADEGGSPQAASEVARLKGELAAALETSEASRQENVELRERLASLQEQIDAMQRLTTLQDDTLAALQAGAESPAEQQAAASAALSAEDKAAGEGTADEKPARKPASTPATDTSGGLLDDPNILAMAGAAGVALVILLWLVVRRRRNAAMFDESADAGTAGESHDDIAPPAWAAAAQQPVQAMEAEGQGAASTAESEPEDGGLDLMQSDDDEIDVLAEADVYLAYRRFDKAEELLREAIKSEPGRRDLMLKLLEVQAASGNKNAFVTQAESFRSMFGSGDAALWDKVVAMGRRIAPEHAMFGGAAMAAAASAARAGGGQAEDLGNDFSALELDADIAAELDKLGGADYESPAEQSPHSDMDISAPVGPAEDTSLLDMDLSLDDAAGSEAGGAGLGELAEEHFADPDPGLAGTLGNASNVIAFESRTGISQGTSGMLDEDATGQPSGAASPAGPDHDLDWLTGVGEDLGPLDDAGGSAEDDFSSLISGEDEVGTKLDLAKAYIDMGDQDSARNILNEVVQEGSQDQQREASDLMRQIG
ncbi:MAG: FimV/HubP family polar landmark protein [Gammaproteobacteria bacterium]